MARRKITRDEDGEELPDLTPKQMEFCAGILAGKSQTEAYRLAFDCTTMSTPAIQVEASRLRHNSKIALWLDAARSDTLASHACTLDGHLQELERLKAIAIRTGNVGAAVQAEQLRGKASGHYVEQYRELAADDPIKTLNEIAAIDERLARSLAERDGIPWMPESETKH